MDFLIEISGGVEERSGTFDDGRSWSVREQKGHLFMPGEKYPVPVLVRVRREGFAEGKYRWRNPIEYFRGELRVPKFFDLEPVPVKAAGPGATRP